MIKKIRSKQLKPGMFISDLNCGWMEHPFWSNSLYIKNQEAIKKIIAQGITEVYIDTSKGKDVDESDVLTDHEVQQKLDDDLKHVMEKKAPVCDVRKPQSFQEEMQEAVSVRAEATQIVGSLLEDARLGKQMEIDKTEHVVNNMVESIFRNGDALTTVCRLKSADQYTFEHSVSVCVLMVAFARGLEFDKETIKEVAVGGLLHDVGKMRVPQRILNKPGRLSEEEFKIMRDHVVYSGEILENAPGVSSTSKMIAVQHHERYDGAGYPRGLKGEDISLYGQMSAIVDVYDAITSDRCYHKGMQAPDALRKILEWSEFHFNRSLVESFIRSVGIYPTGTLIRLGSNKLAVVVERGLTDLLKPKVRVVYDLDRNQRTIFPYDIDLEKAHDEIVGHEDPVAWQIDPEAILTKKPDDAPLEIKDIKSAIPSTNVAKA